MYQTYTLYISLFIDVEQWNRLRRVEKLWSAHLWILEIELDFLHNKYWPGNPAVDPRGSSGLPRTDGRLPAKLPGGATVNKEMNWPQINLQLFSTTRLGCAQVKRFSTILCMLYNKPFSWFTLPNKKNRTEIRWVVLNHRLTMYKREW
jgi:hypothetical protein